MVNKLSLLLLALELAIIIGNCSGYKSEKPAGYKSRNGGWYRFNNGVACDYNYNLTAVGQRMSILSPNYPLTYPPNYNCNYNFQSPEGTTMTLTCPDFNLKDSQYCSTDIFWVSLQGDFKRGLKFCGPRSIGKLTTASNRLAMSFQSDIFYYEDTYPYSFWCIVEVIQGIAPPPIIIPPTTTLPPKLPIPACSCGIRPARQTSRIVNGTDTKPGDFPWRCQIKSEFLARWYCGCTIIDKDWVLTAAHCLEAVNSDDLLEVSVGEYDTSAPNSNRRIIEVVERYAHENYNRSSQDNDLALLKLRTSVEFSQMIQPICLPWDYGNVNLNGYMVTACGWGLRSHGGEAVTILQSVELPILETNECREQGRYGEWITENMICTYREYHDTCQGDSGGSIDLFDRSRQRYVAVGVTSWGIGCAYPTKPGVYAKLTLPKYMTWIENLLASKGSKICRD